MKRKPSVLNMLLAVDKPAGMTSLDVVNQMRRAVGERRVGHAGTLDPAATGVMVIGVGQATRLMGHLTAERKSYLATVEFGSETDTEDAEGSVIRRAPVPAEVRDPAFASRTLAGLVGEYMQVPPAYSAISVNGQRAYARARAGEDVDLEARPIVVFEAQLLSVEVADNADAQGSEPMSCVVRWQCAFTVSKGTYVRSIARDLGRAVGSAAHLGRLRRSVSGLVTLADCVPLEKLEEFGPAGASRCALDPLRVLGLSARELSERERTDVLCGRMIPVGDVRDVDASVRGRLALEPRRSPLRQGDEVALYSDGRLWGIWRVRGAMLRSSVNFPAGITGVSV